MARHNPFSIQLQVTKLFNDGQGFFAKLKVQEWLKMRGEDPEDYTIAFRKEPAAPGSGQVEAITIVLTRKDGQTVDSSLLADLGSI
ncbi:MAG: hypothetical protein HC860_17290 [Alkalinema sp. RU_4_3]|nr:hypothetical protein [Alkalinema sp. RU_4_3]